MCGSSTPGNCLERKRLKIRIPLKSQKLKKLNNSCESVCKQKSEQAGKFEIRNSDSKTSRLPVWLQPNCVLHRRGPRACQLTQTHTRSKRHHTEFVCYVPARYGIQRFVRGVTNRRESIFLLSVITSRANSSKSRKYYLCNRLANAFRWSRWSCQTAGRDSTSCTGAIEVDAISDLSV